MLWVLWDIVLPLIATFLLGLFIGWLLWRWRRSRIDAEGLSKMRRESSRNRADVQRLQESNIELSDRLQAASGAAGGELAGARKRIDMLTEELSSSRREVAQLRSSQGDHRNTGSEAAQLYSELQTAQQRIVELERSSGVAAPDSAEMIDLRRQIESRDRMIATLETSHKQYSESGDTTALMADIALRDRKIAELESLIATRNRN